MMDKNECDGDLCAESVWKPAPEIDKVEVSNADVGNQSPMGKTLARDKMGSIDILGLHVAGTGTSPFRRLSMEQYGRISEKVIRRLSTEAPTPTRQNLNGHLPVRRYSISEEHIFAEMDLYEIKHHFEMIERLWRELSMGTDRILASVLASVQGYLGEIGSELFSTMFMNNSVRKQALFEMFSFFLKFCCRNVSLKVI